MKRVKILQEIVRAKNEAIIELQKDKARLIDEKMALIKELEAVKERDKRPMVCCGDWVF